jgi:hypothetical protein
MCTCSYELKLKFGAKTVLDVLCYSRFISPSSGCMMFVCVFGSVSVFSLFSASNGFVLNFESESFFAVARIESSTTST